MIDWDISTRGDTSEEDQNSLEQIPDKSRSANPEDVLIKKEMQLRIQQAINQLSSKEHTAFVLSKIDGLSDSEVARRMRRSIPQVNGYINRARAKLRELLIELISSNP